MLGIAALAVFLYAWNIASVGFAPFYSVTVKSMSESWKAFFYGAFDPGATITIDKLPGAFLPQAISARIFGFHSWSLVLPQVIEGVISVLVMYRVTRRWAGVTPGLLAAGIFALTPVVASLFGHSMEDGALLMCLVLAADAYQRAAIEARPRSLIMAGVWVGLGFQAKMLEAWMVLPALAAGYLLTAPEPLRDRLRHLSAAGAVMLAVSLSWIALYALTPAADRPFTDGTTSNSPFAMVFGYNGLDLLGIKFPGAISLGTAVNVNAGPAAAFRSSSSPGWGKLLGERFGPQVGWLYPLALLALVCGLIWLRRAGRTDTVRGGFVMWGAWLLVFGVIFSADKSIPHAAYVAALAPPLAALSAAGIVMFLRLHVAGDPRGWVLPAAVAAELAWAMYLWRGYGGFLPWAPAVVLVVGVCAVAWMTAAWLTGTSRQTGTSGRPGSSGLSGMSWRLGSLASVAGLAAGVAAMLTAPVAWATSVLDTRYDGSSLEASAGPDQLFGSIAGVSHPAEAAGSSPITRIFGELISATSSTTLSPSEQRIYDYVSARRDGASYLLAAQSWIQTSPYLLATRQEVLTMGGFLGSTPEPTLATVQRLVGSGKLRFFLLDRTGLLALVEHTLGAGGGISQSAEIVRWVEASCTAVPPAAYGAAPVSGGVPGTGGTPGPGGVPGPGAPGSGGAARAGLSMIGSGAGTLYECGRKTAADNPNSPQMERNASARTVEQR